MRSRPLGGLLLALSLLTGCASAGGTMRAGDAATTTSAGSQAGSQVRNEAGNEAGEGNGGDNVSAGAVPARGDAGPVARPRNSAAIALQSQAEASRRAGNPDQAAATLERAVRIAPDDAELWLALASLRLQQGQTQQAIELARRAESLAPQGSALRVQARDLQQQAGVARK
ncbi:MAG: tetratricopeptide repeat protein [Gammaproteobacteria bacterium]